MLIFMALASSRKAIGSIHLHRIDFRSYPFGIDVDSSDNIQSIPLQA